MNQIKKHIDKALVVVTSMLIVLITVLVLWQIFTRTVLNNPSTLTEETVRFAFVWLSMLTAAYVVGTHGHMSVTLLNDKLNPKRRKKLAIFVQTLFIIFSLVIMIYGGIKSVQITMAQSSPSMNLPMGYVFMSVPVAGVFMLLYSVNNLLNIVKDNMDKKIETGEKDNGIIS